MADYKTLKSNSLASLNPTSLNVKGISNSLTLDVDDNTSGYTLKFPADVGTAGQVLSTGGNGSTAWISSGASGAIPVNGIDFTTPSSIYNPGVGVWQAVPGFTSTVNITSTVPIYAVASLNIVSPGSGGVVFGSRLVINSSPEQEGVEITTNISNNGDVRAQSIRLLTSSLPPGTYTVRLEIRQFSGSGTLRVDSGTLMVQGQQAPAGPQGAAGANGAGVTKVADATARLALSPTDGDVVVQLDTDEMYVYTGSVWQIVGSSGGAHDNPFKPSIIGNTISVSASTASDGVLAEVRGVGISKAAQVVNPIVANMYESWVVGEYYSGVVYYNSESESHEVLVSNKSYALAANAIANTPFLSKKFYKVAAFTAQVSTLNTTNEEQLFEFPSTFTPASGRVYSRSLVSGTTLTKIKSSSAPDFAGVSPYSVHIASDPVAKKMYLCDGYTVSEVNRTDASISPSAISLSVNSGLNPDRGRFCPLAGRFLLSSYDDPTYASYDDSGDSGVYFQADNPGLNGNNIYLPFNGVDDIDTIVGAWNSSNGSNMVSHNGSGTEIPSGPITLSGGLDSVYYIDQYDAAGLWLDSILLASNPPETIVSFQKEGAHYVVVSTDGVDVLINYFSESTGALTQGPIVVTPSLIPNISLVQPIELTITSDGQYWFCGYDSVTNIKGVSRVNPIGSIGSRSFSNVKNILRTDENFFLVPAKETIDLVSTISTVVIEKDLRDFNNVGAKTDFPSLAISGDFTHTSQLNKYGNLSVSGDLTLTAGLTVYGDLVVEGSLIGTWPITVSGNVIVGGAIKLNLTNQDIFIGGSLHILPNLTGQNEASFTLSEVTEYPNHKFYVGGDVHIGNGRYLALQPTVPGASTHNFTCDGKVVGRGSFLLSTANRTTAGTCGTIGIVDVQGLHISSFQATGGAGISAASAIFGGRLNSMYLGDVVVNNFEVRPGVSANAVMNYPSYDITAKRMEILSSFSAGVASLFTSNSPSGYHGGVRVYSASLKCKGGFTLGSSASPILASGVWSTLLEVRGDAEIGGSLTLQTGGAGSCIVTVLGDLSIASSFYNNRHDSTSTQDHGATTITVGGILTTNYTVLYAGSNKPTPPSNQKAGVLTIKADRWICTSSVTLTGGANHNNATPLSSIIIDVRHLDIPTGGFSVAGGNSYSTAAGTNLKLTCDRLRSLGTIALTGGNPGSGTPGTVDLLCGAAELTGALTVLGGNRSSVTAKFSGHVVKYGTNAFSFKGGPGGASQGGHCTLEFISTLHVNNTLTVEGGSGSTVGVLNLGFGAAAAIGALVSQPGSGTASTGNIFFMGGVHHIGTWNINPNRFTGLVKARTVNNTFGSAMLVIGVVTPTTGTGGTGAVSATVNKIPTPAVGANKVLLGHMVSGTDTTWNSITGVAVV